MVCDLLYDCTCMTWLYLMKNNDEVFSIFQVFHCKMQTQFSIKIQVLRSDDRGEFINNKF